MEAIIVDLDGVICDVGYEATPETFKWVEFMEKAKNPDEIFWDTIRMINGLQENMGYIVIFLTARPEFMREVTKDMLAYAFSDGDFGEAFSPYVLVMDNPLEQIKRDDGSPADYVHRQMLGKKEHVITLLEQYDIKLAIDDQKLNTDMFKSLGIPTVLVDLI